MPEPRTRPLVLAAPAVAGCALTAPVPGGPVRANSVTQLQPSWALAYGRASASVGGARVSGNGQTFGGPLPWGAPIPIRIGLRQAVGSVVEVSGDWGWVDSGVELRAGSPEGSWPVPMAISAGVRSSDILTIPTSESGGIGFALNQGTHERRLRVEAYPEMSMGWFGAVRLILSAGVSWGAFAHDLVLGPGQTAGGVVIGPVGVMVVRPETRLELAIGIYKRGTRGTATLALAPYILLDSGAPTRARCVECAQTGPVSDFSQNWGVSLIVSPALVGDLIAWLSGER